MTTNSGRRVWSSRPVEGDNRTIDPILEHLDTRGVSRRDILKISSVGLAAVSVGGMGLLSACGNGSTSVTSSGKGRLAHLIMIPNEYMTTAATAGKQTAKVLKLDAYTEGNTDLDPVKSVDLANQYIGGRYDMLWVAGIDGSEVRPINQAATAAKAYHSQMWAAAPWFMPVDANKYYTAFWDLHEPDNIYGSTKLMLAELTERLGTAKGKIFHISGVPGASIATKRTMGVHQAIDEFPTLTLTGELPGSWDPVKAQQAFRDLVGRYGKPDGVVCSNDAMLTGALAAAEGLGYKPGEDVLLCGQDGNPDILRAIDAGSVYSTNFHGPHTFAVQPIVRLFDSLNGVEFGPLERQMSVTGINVTKDNVGGLLQRYYASKNRLPFDPRLVSRHLHPDDWDPQASLAPIDIEAYWDGIEEPPADYKFPADYSKALADDGMKKVEELYASHYKIKMDDFSFKGVDV